jgi:hypothetical protein
MEIEMSAVDRFLSLATPDSRQKFQPWLDRAASGWAEAQAAFLEMTDDYIEGELAKPADANIDTHEAGGQWRIAFPHYAVRGDERIPARFEAVMAARKAYVNKELFHGYPDCAEVHHHPETFLYFQNPLIYAGLPGAELATESADNFAKLCGNWIEGVPEWYDWKHHGFRSTWLGTREVRAQPPYDYQEANHFRLIDIVLAAWMGTGDDLYIDLAMDYADTWCAHIKRHSDKGGPIPCAILPEGATAREMGYSGKRKVDDKAYAVFYSTVAENTAYDVACTLLDLYRVTGMDDYLAASRAMMFQFFKNGSDGRPAYAFGKGAWRTGILSPNPDVPMQTFVQTCNFSARYAMRHDMVTGTDWFRRRMLKWANAIDEDANDGDQMDASVLIAAHYYDGNPEWLQRAYAMALRFGAVTDGDDRYHQCGWRASRQGGRLLMEMLYAPMLAGCEWGTRGSVPVRRLAHEMDGAVGMPKGVAFRTWRQDGAVDAYEGVNLGADDAIWTLAQASEEFNGDGAAVTVEPGETKGGSLKWAPRRPLRPTRFKDEDGDDDDV